MSLNLFKRRGAKNYFMPVSIPEKMIKEIAEMLDSGMLCFYRIPTGEMEYYPDESRGHAGFDEEPWQEMMDKVENDYLEYIPFAGMESRESFRVMETFVENLSDAYIRQRFTDAISFKKPFQNFNQMLLNYPKLLEEWFTYKSEKYMEWVRDELKKFNGRESK